MDRATLLQSNHYPYRIFTLGELLDDYGIDYVATMSGINFRFYHPLPPNSNFNNALKRGRPVHHVNKTTGTIKKKFKNWRISDIIYCEVEKLERFPNPKLLKSALKIAYHYKRYYRKRVKNAIYIQKYVKRFLVKKAFEKAKYVVNQGIDFCVDPISCDAIKFPVVISKDWEQNCKQIYDLTTIRNCKYVSSMPIYFYEDATGQTMYIEREILKTDGYGNAVYRSPLTRAEFTCDDVIFLEKALWYKVGCLLQSKT